MSITFSLISQDRVVDEFEVDEVLLPTTLGEIGVLPNHVNLITMIKTGEITTHSSNKTNHFSVFGGVAEITDKTVTVMADRAEHVDSIDLAAAEAAVKAATSLQDKAKNDVEFAHAAALLERNLNRINVVKRHRHHSTRTHQSDNLTK
ncbi:MAG: ATP synthase F1 subunit epsilon [Patescibacteria group bacterium]|jgi:F-type H+-transporting ATPase subunit epsilon